MVSKVVHGCDPNAWHRDKNGVQVTLLHRAILLHDTVTACFLIRNGADVNSATRPGSSGVGFSPPLHLACERGLVDVVQCLMEHHVNVNATVSYYVCMAHYITQYGSTVYIGIAMVYPH